MFSFAELITFFKRHNHSFDSHCLDCRVLFWHVVHTLAFTEELADIQCAALMVLNLRPIVLLQWDFYNSQSSIQRLFLFDNIVQRKHLVSKDTNTAFGFSPVLRFPYLSPLSHDSVSPSFSVFLLLISCIVSLLSPRVFTFHSLSLSSPSFCLFLSPLPCGSTEGCLGAVGLNTT